MNKVYNFSPGPSKINESVIKEVKKSIENYKDTGKSILEISHRSKDFEEILDVINQNFQVLFGLPNDFKILLLQGGATFQNSLIPFNVGPEKSIGCLVNGTWGQKTYEDFSKINNKIFTVGGSKKSYTSLKQLTHICERITNNKIKWLVKDFFLCCFLFL